MRHRYSASCGIWKCCMLLTFGRAFSFCFMQKCKICFDRKSVSLLAVVVFIFPSACWSDLINIASALSHLKKKRIEMQQMWRWLLCYITLQLRSFKSIKILPENTSCSRPSLFLQRQAFHSGWTRAKSKQFPWTKISSWALAFRFLKLYVEHFTIYCKIRVLRFESVDLD